MSPNTEHPAAPPEVQLALTMPSRADLVHEAIARFDTAGRRSQLLQMDTRTLEDLGLQLSDRESNPRQAWLWLLADLGSTEADPVVEIKAVYRFASHFRAVYDQVRAEHARRLARLSVAQVTAGNVRDMTRLAQSRLTELIAEKLAETNNLEELSSAQINSVITAVDAHSRAEFKAEELRLQAIDSERQAADSEARRRELLTRIAALPSRLKAVEARVGQLEELRQQGKPLSPVLFRSIRQELIAMAHEVPAAPATPGTAAVGVTP